MTVDVLIFTGSLGALMKPSGAYRIATELRKYGYTVQVVDDFLHLCKNTKLLWDIIDKFVGENTLWVGFSTTFFVDIVEYHQQEISGKVLTGENTRQLNAFGLPLDSASRLEMRRRIKDKNPNCKLVLGGAKSAAMGETTMDVYIEGYADTSVIKFTKWLENKNPFFQYRVNPGKPGVRFDSISVIDDIKASLFDFNASQIDWQPQDLVLPGEALPIEISRGCIFSCAFCTYPLNGKKKLDFIKAPEVLIEEFERNYALYQTVDYFFSDDTFNDSPIKLEELYDKVFSKLSFKIHFYVYLRLDLLTAHPHTIDLLHASGLAGAFFGVETLNHASSKAIGKGMHPDKLVKTLHTVKERWGNDVKTTGSFIIGLPHETEQTATKWLDQVSERDSPLDHVLAFSLLISRHKKGKNWWSELERNPSKYGYTIDQERGWYNEHWDYSAATALSYSYLERLHANRKKQISDYNIPAHLNMGFTREQIHAGLQITDVPLATRAAMRRKMIDSYFARLMSLEVPNK